MMSHERHVVSNHRSFDCLFNSLCRHTSSKTTKSSLLALCHRGDFPVQTVSKAEKASIWWRHHVSYGITGSINGFSPVWWLVIIQTNAVIFLAQWGRDKMAAISQTTYSNVFSWIEMLEFRLKFHWSLSLDVQLTNITTYQYWFR